MIFAPMDNHWGQCIPSCIDISQDGGSSGLFDKFGYLGNVIAECRVLGVPLQIGIAWL